MKTETDMMMLGLVLLVVAGIFFAIYSGGQVDMAAAQVGATVAAEQLPEAAVVAGQLSGWALKTLLGIVGVAIGSTLIVLAQRWWKNRQAGRNWKRGPNARWQQEQPRQTSMESMLQMMMLREMMQQRSAKNQPARPTNDDDLGIDF